jgi:hypothetical protein
MARQFLGAKRGPTRLPGQSEFGVCVCQYVLASALGQQLAFLVEKKEAKVQVRLQLIN